MTRDDAIHLALLGAKDYTPAPDPDDGIDVRLALEIACVMGFHTGRAGGGGCRHWWRLGLREGEAKAENLLALRARNEARRNR